MSDTLVVNPAPDESTPVWRLSDEPTLAIGHEGDTLYEFFRVGGVRTLSDGRIVVANYPAALRYYDGTGRHLMTAGRRGPGPEEIHDWISRIHVIGDTVVALDPSNADSRLVLFDGNGRVVRAFQPAVSPSFVTDDGEWVGEPRRRHGASRDCPKLPTARASRREIVRTGGVFGTRRLATILGGWSFLIERCNSLPMPFTPRGSFTVGAGKLFTTLDSTHTVHVRSLESGRVERTIATREVPRRLTQAMIDYRAPRPPGARALAAEPSGPLKRIEALMPPPPPTLPAIGSLSVDAVGNLWVRRYYVPADTTHEWWIYDTSGRLVAQLTNRTRFRFTEIGADFVLGVFRDHDDVETVRRYALLK
jgi:hypothetical protein